jgi:hypothetical protein
MKAQKPFEVQTKNVIWQYILDRQRFPSYNAENIITPKDEQKMNRILIKISQL